MILSNISLLDLSKYQYLLCNRSVVLLGVSSTNKTDCQDITEILLKVVLNTITPLNGYEGLLFQRCQLIEILISKLWLFFSLIYIFSLPLWYLGHCVVCPSLIYIFSLPLWYLKIFLHAYYIALAANVNLWHMTQWCYKPGDKSWMRKGPDCEHNIEHIHGHLWHRYSITDALQY
jgi:hypothetical protein